MRAPPAARCAVSAAGRTPAGFGGRLCSLNINSVRPAAIHTSLHSAYDGTRWPSTQVPFCEFKSLTRKQSPSRQIMKCRRESVSSRMVMSAVSSRPTAAGWSPIAHCCATAPSSANRYKSAILHSSRLGCRGAKAARQPLLILDTPGQPKVTIAFALVQHIRAFLVALEDQLAEDRVGPGEPGARELARVVLVKRFVHEASAGVSLLQREKHLAHFLVFHAGESLDDQAQRPDHVPSNVRPPRPIRGLADAIIRVAVGQDEPACIEVERVTGRDRIDIRQGEQAGDIAVVDAVVISVAVDFVRENAAELRVDEDGVF